MHVEHRPKGVTRVRMQVAPVPLLGALIEVVVLRNEPLELRLHVDDLLGGELELHDGDAGGLEVCEEADLARL